MAPPSESRGNRVSVSHQPARGVWRVSKRVENVQIDKPSSSNRFRLHFSEMAIPPHGVPQGLPTRGWAGEDLHLAAAIIVKPFDVPLARDHDVLENLGGFGHCNLPVLMKVYESHDPFTAPLRWGTSEVTVPASPLFIKTIVVAQVAAAVALHADYPAPACHTMSG